MLDQCCRISPGTGRKVASNITECRRERHLVDRSWSNRSAVQEVHYCLAGDLSVGQPCYRGGPASLLQIPDDAIDGLARFALGLSLVDPQLDWVEAVGVEDEGDNYLATLELEVWAPSSVRTGMGSAGCNRHTRRAGPRLASSSRLVSHNGQAQFISVIANDAQPILSEMNPGWSAPPVANGTNPLLGCQYKIGSDAE